MSRIINNNTKKGVNVRKNYLGFLLLSSTLLSAELTKEVKDQPIQLADLVVIGSKDSVTDLVGNGSYLDTEDIRFHNYANVNQVLRKVPGVYIREENGFGLFPNISLRGVDSSRSKKVTLMEDGILIAPAPYCAPETYYSPTIGRMSGLEVLKGSCQTKYGPHTTGGVINYLSTPFTLERQGYLKSSYGMDGDFRLHTYFTDQKETDLGVFGYLIEYYQQQNDGFKNIQGDSKESGFKKSEPMLKLFWEPKGDLYQRFELKLAYSDATANESYLGITKADFREDPYQRYNGSRFDEFNSQHATSYLRHYIEISDDVRLTTTGYYNDYHRNWYKIAKVNGGSLSEAVATGGNAANLATLKGGAGTLDVRANNRDYYSYGIQTTTGIDFKTDSLDHELELGLRFHCDGVRRFQHDDIYTQNAAGQITNIAFGAPGSESNRRQETKATALSIEDKMSFGKWSVTPGIRYEHLEMNYSDHNAGTDTQYGTMDIFAGGIGVNYKESESLSFFGGIYKGISTPSPRGHIKDDLDEEHSVTTELGSRYNFSQKGALETTVFYSEFKNLIVGGNLVDGNEETENAGDVTSFGLELKLEQDLDELTDWGINMPVWCAFTWTHARLDGDSQTKDAKSLFSGGKDGNCVPYIPEYQISLGIGLHGERTGCELTATWIDDTFTTANNSSQEVNPITGTPDARFGKTDEYFVVNVTTYYKITEDLKVFASIHNLFDDVYVASRHSDGIRPGQPFSAMLGFEYFF